MLTLLQGIATMLAVAGVLLNNRRRRACFALWVVSNVLCGGLHMHAGLWGLVVRDALFTVLAVEGWCRWGAKQMRNAE